MDYRSILLGLSLILVEVLLGYLVIRNKKPAILLPAILMLGLVLRIIPALDLELHQWDESYHALVAKHLTGNYLLPTLYADPVLPYDYTNWTSNAIWLHKPPLALWCMAFSLQVFGCHAFAVRIPSILFSTLTIYLTYRIGLKFTTKQNGLLAAYLCSINGFLIDLCSGRIATDHVDTLFVFLIALGIYTALQDATASHRSYRLSVLTGVITGLAVLTKWATGLFILGMYLIAWIHDRQQPGREVLKKILFAGMVSCLVFLPWNIYAYLHFPKEYLHEQFYNLAHLNTALEGHNQPWWFYLENARINWNELMYLHAAVFVFLWINKKLQHGAFVFSWIAVPYVLFSIASTKMSGYIAICAPAVFVMIALSLAGIQNNRMKVIFLVLTIALGIRYSIERIKPFERFEKQKNYAGLATLSGENGQPLVLFGYKDYIPAMFFYDMVVYERYPSEQELENIGHARIIAIDAPDLPDFMRRDSSVIIIQDPAF